MYMAQLITLLTQAVRDTFNSNYPITEFQNVHTSPEFPILRADYPAIWIDFEPTQPLHTSGIDQFLYTAPDENNVVHAFKTWLFQGYATFTIMALSSLERDRLFDEVVKMFAFSQLNPQLNIFRTTIENNEWIATNIDFDQIQQRGKSASAGTPWGSDEILYEITAAVQCIGQFNSDLSTGEFILLDQVQFVSTELPDGPTDTFDYPVG